MIRRKRSATKRKPPLGSGERFRQLSRQVGSDALAAWIGRKKYGVKRFAELSAKGRRRKRS